MDPRSSVHLVAALSSRKDGNFVPLEFANADLRGTLYVRADLSGGDFSGARLERCNFSGAKCIGTRFVRAQLQGAILNGADLTGAKLRGADLSQARLEGACLAHADCTLANIGQTSGMPSSVAKMRLNQITVKRSRLTDEQVIELYRQGATLVDLEEFSPRVREACAPQVPQELPVVSRRLVSLDELVGLNARVTRSLPSAVSDSLPPSVTEMMAAQPISQHPSDSPNAGPRSYVFVQSGDLLLGATLGERLSTLGSLQRFAATGTDGSRCVAVLYDPSADPRGVSFSAFRRGVRNLNRICELGDKTPVRIPELVAVEIDELGYVCRDLWNGSLGDLQALKLGRDEQLKFFRAICQSVSGLHTLGIVHRCLCPSTVLIGDDLKPVLTDIDAIDLLELGERGESDLDAYAAPEELRGQSAYSPTADVYSLGQLLCYMMTGSHPQKVTKARGPFVAPAGMSRGVARIISKATQFAPSMRYQQVASLLDELARHENADEVGCDTIMPPDALTPRAVSVPEAPATNKLHIAQYPGLADPWTPSAAEPGQTWHHWVRWLGVGGVVGAVACLLTGILAPTLSVGAARVLGVVFGICAGLSLLDLPMPAMVTPRLRLLLGIFATLVLWQLDPQSVMTLRWSFTLRHGSEEQRARAVKSLVRSGKRILRGANLTEADLSRIDLVGVDLREASLVRANLRSATLAEADLAGARLSEANLQGSDLHLSNAPAADGWLSTHCDRLTRMPDGWLCGDGHPQRRE